MARFRLTIEQCQFLLNSSVGFNLPDKLGEATYTFVDKSLASDEVRSLYRALRAYSPAMQDASLNKRRLPIFGEKTAWDIELDEKGGIKAASLKHPETPVSLELDNDSVSGAMWCLLLAVHPDSKESRVGVSSAETLVWPTAVILGKSRALRDAIGLTRTEKRRRWDDDPAEEKPAQPAVVAEAHKE